MSKIAIVGGGIAGVTAAVELAKTGNHVIIIEKEDELGGNLKNYGCKAVETCTKCNLCLVDELLLAEEDLSNINVLFQTRINDLIGKKGDYTLGIENTQGFNKIEELDYIILATGFTRWSELETGTSELTKDKKIIWAGELEEYLLKRRDHDQDNDPLRLGSRAESVAFFQCNGSRSIQEKASYCSKVCCAYSYRMARVLKYFYPEIKINIFFMDLQEGGYLQDITFNKLTESGIDYINCRPIRVENRGSSLLIVYENQQKGQLEELETKLLVLSEGMHSPQDNEKWSELFNLQLDEHGFLTAIEDELTTGIYLAGTIKGPKDIAATITDSRNVVYRILNQEGK